MLVAGEPEEVGGEGLSTDLMSPLTMAWLTASPVPSQIYPFPQVHPNSFPAFNHFGFSSFGPSTAHLISLLSFILLITISFQDHISRIYRYIHKIDKKEEYFFLRMILFNLIYTIYTFYQFFWFF